VTKSLCSSVLMARGFLLIKKKSFEPFFGFLQMNNEMRIRMDTMNAAPPVIPATAPRGRPLLGFWDAPCTGVVVPVDGGDDDGGGGVEDAVSAGVDEGAFSRHDELLELPTMRTSEVPPIRPIASTMERTTDVPALTLAVQSNEFSLETGGLRTKDWPPGIRPKIVTGWTAPA
jgi:hypothetical protein